MNEMAENRPFLLKSAFKDYLWGGKRLREDYGQETDNTPLAEAWVCSTHREGVSFVSSKEISLLDLLSEHPEYLGTHPRTDMGLPILVKLIDAKLDLSVQVHPDDDYAYMHENGEQGKTELWYVLHAEKGARLIYGFKHDVSKEDIRKSVENGTIGKHLQYVNVEKDDVSL